MTSLWSCAPYPSGGTPPIHIPFFFAAAACSGDFLLRLAGCQREDLVAEVRRTALAASGFCGRRGLMSSRWSGYLLCRSRPSGCGRLFYLRALAVARKHTLARLQFAELTGELVALQVDARKRFADPLLLLGDLVQCRHSVPPPQSIG